MNSRDLPGPGDAATWGHHASAPGSPDYDERWRDPETIEADLQELREWVESFATSAKHLAECSQGNVSARVFHERMRLAKSLTESKMDALIKEWKP